MEQLATTVPTGVDKRTTEELARQAPAVLPADAEVEAIKALPDGRPDLAWLNENGQESRAQRYLERVQAVAELRRRYQAAATGQRGKVRRELAAELGVSARTLQRWDRTLRDAGPLALVPTEGVKARGRFPSMPRALQRLVKGYYLDGRRPTAAQIYRHAVEPWCRKRGVPVPSISTVRRFLDRAVLPIEATVFRRGWAAWQAESAPKVRRSLDDLEVGSLWVADHRLLDLFTLVDDGHGRGWPRHKTLPCPCGSGRERRKCCSVVRPWFTVVFDVKSVAIVGYRLGLTPTAGGVVHVLAEALRAYGIPDAFYRDNGKEFNNALLTADPVNLQKPTARDLRDADHWPVMLPQGVDSAGLLSTFGIKSINSIPFHAWSKPAEPFLGAFAKTFENLFVGHTGRNAREKPELLARHMKAGRLTTWTEFVELFHLQVVRWNLKGSGGEVGQGVGERTKPPFAFWEGVDRPRPSREALAYLCQRVEREVKINAGSVRIGNYTFWSNELALYVGLRCSARWDPEYPQGGVFCYFKHRLIWAPLEVKARYLTWGPANLEKARAQKLQRLYFSNVRSGLHNNADLQSLDPTGSYRVVAAREMERTHGVQMKALTTGRDAEAEAAYGARVTAARLLVKDVLQRAIMARGDRLDGRITSNACETRIEELRGRLCQVVERGAVSGKAVTLLVYAGLLWSNEVGAWTAARKDFREPYGGVALQSEELADDVEFLAGELQQIALEERRRGAAAEEVAVA